MTDKPAHSLPRGETIQEFEGLRGLLSLWVLLGHWGTTIALRFPFPQDFLNTQAVNIFIVLSGFVITLLLHRAPTGYGQYITRRWFRIAPAYLVVLVVSMIYLLPTQDTLIAGPDSAMKETRITLIADALTHYGLNVWTHLFMLHGLVPDAVTPYAAYAFVGQAWSITLEWQFYLLAPLFYYILRRPGKGWTRWMDCAALIIVLAAPASLFGQAYIGNQLPLFALGAGSFLLYDQAARGRIGFRLWQLRVLMLLLLAAGMASRQHMLMGMGLWALCFGTLLAGRFAGGKPEALACNILKTRPLQFLGRISYTLYLVHFLVMIAGMRLLAWQTVTPVEYAAYLLAFMVPVSILTAWLLSIAVERPAMRLGKRLTTKSPKA